MPALTSIVTEIYQGTIKSGRSKGAPFWSITLDEGQKLSTFEEEYVRDVKKGKQYTFDYKTDGQYCNLTGAPTPVIQTDSDLTDPVVSPFTKDTLPQTQGIDPLADKRILSNVTSSEGSERTYKNRISALQAAVNYVTATMGGTSAEKDVVDTAIRFEGYIENGK